MTDFKEMTREASLSTVALLRIRAGVEQGEYNEEMFSSFVQDYVDDYPFAVGYTTVVYIMSLVMKCSTEMGYDLMPNLDTISKTRFETDSIFTKPIKRIVENTGDASDDEELWRDVQHNIHRYDAKHLTRGIIAIRVVMSVMEKTCESWDTDAILSSIANRSLAF